MPNDTQDPRPEGVYASAEAYPPEPRVGSSRLIKIERVAGNQTVTALVVTRKEARSLIEQLLEAELLEAERETR